MLHFIAKLLEFHLHFNSKRKLSSALHLMRMFIPLASSLSLSLSLPLSSSFVFNNKILFMQNTWKALVHENFVMKDKTEAWAVKKILHFEFKAKLKTFLQFVLAERYFYFETFCFIKPERINPFLPSSLLFPTRTSLKSDFFLLGTCRIQKAAETRFGFFMLFLLTLRNIISCNVPFAWIHPSVNKGTRMEEQKNLQFKFPISAK